MTKWKKTLTATSLLEKNRYLFGPNIFVLDGGHQHPAWHVAEWGIMHHNQCWIIVPPDLSLDAVCDLLRMKRHDELLNAPTLKAAKAMVLMLKEK